MKLDFGIKKVTENQRSRVYEVLRIVNVKPPTKPIYKNVEAFLNKYEPILEEIKNVNPVDFDLPF